VQGARQATNNTMRENPKIAIETTISFHMTRKWPMLDQETFSSRADRAGELMPERG